MLCALLLLVGSSAHAQNGFNPENPAEPNLNFYSNVSVTSSPASAAYVSGSGRYLAGGSRSLSTSSRSTYYTFSHWTLNGEFFSSSQRPSYTVAETDMAFVAHYNYTPPSPSEPGVIIKEPLYLVPYPEGACTFNRTSGAKVKFEETVTLKATASSDGFQFLGWYNAGGELVSNLLSFSYKMPAEPVTLTARFEYNPFNPGEPEGSQDNVQTTANGDVNKDGVVDVADVTQIVSIILGNDAEIQTADVNSDGVVDVADVTNIVDIILGF